MKKKAPEMQTETRLERGTIGLAEGKSERKKEVLYEEPENAEAALALSIHSV